MDEDREEIPQNRIPVPIPPPGLERLVVGTFENPAKWRILWKKPTFSPVYRNKFPDNLPLPQSDILQAVLAPDNQKIRDILFPWMGIKPFKLGRLLRCGWHNYYEKYGCIHCHPEIERFIEGWEIPWAKGCLFGNPRENWVYENPSQENPERIRPIVYPEAQHLAREPPITRAAFRREQVRSVFYLDVNNID